MKIRNIKPLFTGVLVTTEKYSEEDVEGLLLEDSNAVGALKEIQKVVSVGDMVRSVSVGDYVKINPMRYARKRYQEGSLKDGYVADNTILEYNFNYIEIGDELYILLQENDLEYIVEY